MKEIIRDVANRLLGMVGVGQIRLVKDGGDQQLVQLELRKGGPDILNELIDDMPRLGHYGFFYRPPFGSEAVGIFIGGRRSSGMIIATGHRETRPRDLEEGEAMMMNTMTGAFIRMSADGKIRSQGDWEHTGSLKTTGDITDNSGSNARTVKDLRTAYNAAKYPVAGGVAGTTDHPVV